MHTLYTYGYGVTKATTLLKVAEKLGACVIDTRLSPRSRLPEWNKGALTSLFGDRYAHVREFGNVNYKIKGMENVRLADDDAGIAILQSWSLNRPAILLCMCPTVEKCHR